MLHHIALLCWLAPAMARTLPHGNRERSRLAAHTVATSPPHRAWRQAGTAATTWNLTLQHLTCKAAAAC